ncbi:MAG: hypothetical protein WCA10_12080 [Terracidiphilus sp.]
MKALPDMLNCPICTEVAPEFVMDTLRDTGTPTLTSPKSIVEGLTDSTDELWFADENAPEFEPQPARPAVIAIAANPSAMAQPFFDPLKRPFVWLTAGRAVTTLSSITENEILQNLSIDITCSKVPDNPVTDAESSLILPQENR